MISSELVRPINPEGNAKGLIAIRPIPEYTAITDSQVDICVVEEGTMATTCSYCLKEAPGLSAWKACGKCKTIRYCSAKCQMTDWPLHKPECKFIIGRGGAGPSQARLIIRLLVKAKSDPAFKAALDKLYVHPGGYKEPWKDLFPYLKPIIEYIPSEISSMDEVHWAFSKLQGNAFLCGVNERCQWMSLICRSSYCNHSCESNAARIETGRTFRIIATKNIAEGEEVVISYVFSCRSLQERREKLMYIYNIFCSCAKCQFESSKEYDATLVDPARSLTERLIKMQKLLDKGETQHFIYYLGGIQKEMIPRMYSYTLGDAGTILKMLIKKVDGKYQLAFDVPGMDDRRLIFSVCFTCAVYQNPRMDDSLFRYVAQQNNFINSIGH